MTVVMVDDVDAALRPREGRKARPSTTSSGSTSGPYGYREYSARDSEGGMWSFMKELADVPACS